ncbi:hypothetical protein [Listeria seeligeri]|uniref:hypothetical protein n=1 Tax=Listeria seeligeri TaxID=1640 RepID=UPI0010E43664|nr:hypothetical protein [Listeria seeligeri]EAC7139271.1 hypothetical protein [Listeria monocytogenes]EEO6569074.1 hypothetical protein [Listeria monocytogenes]EFS0529548.1 hypothetical protein [Listeria monocytogenes]EFU8668800.1 hypothetical protein [Listeria monocytogenes]EHY8358268.1 hypothetical protein [Listeria monocytogenes]
MSQTIERGYVIRASTIKRGTSSLIVKYSKAKDLLVFSTSKLRPVIYKSEAKALIALQEMKVRFPELRFEAIEMKEENNEI